VDVRDQAVRVLATEAAQLLRGRVSEAQIYEQTMSWDNIPCQLWDIILRTRMEDVAPAPVMRDLWVRYVLPSAFFYWDREEIYTDPAATRLWACVDINPI
jgi:hypothetical protein